MGGLQCGEQVVDCLDGDVPTISKCLDVVREVRFEDVHGLVGAECRMDDAFQLRLLEGLMVFERVGGIVGGAHGFDVHLLDEILLGEFFFRENGF